MTRVDELFDELKKKFSHDKHKEFSEALSSELNNKETKPTQERQAELFEMADTILKKIPRHNPKSDEEVRKNEGFESYDPNADRYYMIGGKIKRKTKRKSLKKRRKTKKRKSLKKKRRFKKKYNANI
tara:strand:+ start:120 stop:500 length:381 start_codon:yes stop_codon:yes gene_type:complete